MLVIRTRIHNIKQGRPWSDCLIWVCTVCLACFWQATSVGNFRTFTVLSKFLNIYCKLRLSEMDKKNAQVRVVLHCKATHFLQMHKLHWLLLSADNLCKQYGSRSGPTELRSWSGSKPFDTDSFLERTFWKKFNLKKVNRRHKHAKLPSMQIVNAKLLSL